MNIFYLHADPIKNAQLLHDVHLRKMIVETAQILSFAHHKVNSDVKDNVYLPTHKNNPCMKWVCMSRGNYDWLIKYLKALLDEYEYRFEKEHKTKVKYYHLLMNPNLIDVGFTIPPKVMSGIPDLESRTAEYRCYYKKYKQHDKNRKFIGNYTKREKPEWLK